MDRFERQEKQTAVLNFIVQRSQLSTCSSMVFPCPHTAQTRSAAVQHHTVAQLKENDIFMVLKLL